ncbi:acyl carrier protein [Kitasatospora sp. NPDC052896]|uniref:acyl carrier protein n=1 Tax=Kitasatospora sp. NPDC052896 TaxID=3364061 RepID=UPI0037CC2741
MSAVADRIVGILAERFSMDEAITPSTGFFEIELDSLVMLELSVILESEYGIRIPEDDLLAAGSADAVAALLEVGR